jgi:putative ABC transport system permease protein
MDNWLQDVRFGLRIMRNNLGLTALAVLTLGIGIGATTTIFSVVNAVLIRPLLYKDADRLVMLWATQPELKLPIDKLPISGGDFTDWRKHARSFESISGLDSVSYNLTGSGDPERLDASRVTDNFFQMMGVNPFLGRTFLPGDANPGAEPLVILSYGLWQNKFGANRDILGQTLKLNNKNYTVVGVMPPDFQFPSASDLPSYFEFPPRAQIWTPLVLTEQRTANRRNRDLAVIARLKPGVSLSQAQEEMNAISLGLEQQHPENKNWGVRLLPLQRQIVGNLRGVLLILIGAVGFVLLIACVNVANLLLARAVVRHKEISVRMALGANRLRVVRQLLIESLMLALLGSVVGIILAYAALPLLLTLSPTSVVRPEAIGVDLRVLGFTFLMTLATGIIFGMFPAVQSTKLNLNEMLKEEGRGSTGGLHRSRLRSLLVIAEVALALVLLIGAGLLIRSFSRLLDVHIGFNAQNVMTGEVILPPSGYAEKHQQLAFFQQVLERLRGLQGVEQAGIVSFLPLKGEAGFEKFTVEGQPLPPQGQEPVLSIRVASASYFPAMGIPLLKGRLITDADTQNTPRVAVINAQMARTVWLNEDPLGKRVKVGSGEATHGWEGALFEVVGVVGDVKSLLDAEAKPQIYFSYLQTPLSSMSIAVKAATPMAGVAAMRSAVGSLDKDQPIFNVKSMEQYLSESTAQRRFSVVVLSIFGAVAVTLAAVGLYGLMAYSVMQRKHEVAVRMALGAQRSDVLKLVLKQGLILVVIGLIIGLIAAFALTRLLENLLFEISTTDPITFVLIALLLMLVALCAIIFPALRATRINPLVALRTD